ncbi:MAG: cyclodeaminase/cyclohydrolase family protein [Phycisphaeraceae bacterium]|nr:cyclodeaminase/cyclohydrolase family protein [Phycisphaeraceae bacterium]
MKALESYTIQEFLDAVSARTPTPGGGAVASAVGALGASLAGMVVAYSVGKKSLEAGRSELEKAVLALTRARAVLAELAREDAAAYEAVNTLMRLPETDERRAREWASAASLAVEVPRSVAGACCDLLRLFEHLAPITNPQLRSDLAIAAVLAEAAARSAWWNVAVNLPLLADEAERGRLRSGMLEMLASARERLAKIERACGG